MALVVLSGSTAGKLGVDAKASKMAPHAIAEGVSIMWAMNETDAPTGAGMWIMVGDSVAAMGSLIADAKAGITPATRKALAEAEAAKRELAAIKASHATTNGKRVNA
jgi:hypothetical protein